MTTSSLPTSLHSLKNNPLCSLLEPTPQELFFTKNDSLDPRLGDIFKTINLQHTQNIPDKSLVLIGYPDDQGIKNNGGRSGANLAPQGIRHFLYRMTYPFSTQANFLDMGNLPKEGPFDLQSTHDHLKKLQQELHLTNSLIVSLGGGHDYGYPDSWGFIQSELKKNPHQKPLVINFDAHLDVRADDKGINSGTPFYKMLKEFHGKIDFYEMGIQSHCNSVYHAHFVETHGGKIITLNDIRKHSLNHYLAQIFKVHQHQSLFVSLDIDVMDASEAPGCSQSWPGGLSFHELNNGFDILSQFSFWKQLGIYEVSPPLDINGNTQRAAALFVNRFLHYFKDVVHGSN